MMPPWPKYIQIETTILCNSSCEFCHQRLVKRRPYFMKDQIWRRIIDQTRGRGITYRPFLQNEPLVDRRLEEIVRYIRLDPTARVELNTNGGLLTPERGAELLEAGLDMVRFSIDGFSREVAEKMRPIDFGQAMENAREFIRMAGTASHPCSVEVRMLDCEITRGEQKEYLAYWNSLGARAKVVPLYNWPWSGQESCVPAPCPKIIQEMFFVVDGKAVLCCWDSQERGVIGDVRESTVQEIWTGETNRRYRALLAEGKRGEIVLCSRCDGFRYLLDEGKKTKDGKS
ncbi:MAG TPA: radical SAM/SPASM domain-containing protein [archaeon]|nr:radical SAM/SPASM domain-containing protein [archaeon]